MYGSEEDAMSGEETCAPLGELCTKCGSTDVEYDERYETGGWIESYKCLVCGFARSEFFADDLDMVVAGGALWTREEYEAEIADVPDCGPPDWYTDEMAEEDARIYER